jgi:hypothetical protein
MTVYDRAHPRARRAKHKPEAPIRGPTGEGPAAEFEAVAIDAARAGGQVLRARFADRGRLSVTSKARHDYVTEVDHQAEAAVVDVLRKRVPEHSILAEEGSRGAANSATAGSSTPWTERRTSFTAFPRSRCRSD